MVRNALASQRNEIVKCSSREEKKYLEKKIYSPREIWGVRKNRDGIMKIKISQAWLFNMQGKRILIIKYLFKIFI
jgi:hypothetical protein